MSSKIFEEVYAPSIFDQVYTSPKKEKKQEPISLKGTAKSYGAGFAGGVGGLPGDILKSSGNPQYQELARLAGVENPRDQPGPKTTHEISEEFGGEPVNALERILKQSGEFGGQEALIGTALGGVPGAGLGAAHGSASGALYGGLKELGIDDTWALGITAVASLSPIAAQKLISKYKAGKSLGKAVDSVAKELSSTSEKKAGSVFPGPEEPPPPGGFGPGSVIPEAKGAFETKEAAIKELGKPPETKKLPFEPKFANITTEAPSLEGRASPAKELGEIISKEPFETEAQAGRTIAKDVTEVRDAERTIVRDKYKKAEEVTVPHDDVFPELAAQNEERISKLESITKRSQGEEAVYQDALALRKIVGDQHGLIEANADQLMKQANSFSQKVKYELPYAGYKGEIKSIVHEINKSVIASLQKNGKNAAAVIDADKTFSRFADRFMGDEISPYFSRKILNPEELAKKAVSDPATYRAVKDAIGSRKSPLVNKLDREVVHAVMDKYYKDPSKVNSKEYNKDLKNLAEKIGKEKIAEIDHSLRQRQLTHERKAFAENKIREANPEKKEKREAPKPLKPKEPIAKTPEQIDKLFKSRSDIRRLKKEMQDKGLGKEFETLAEHKIEDIFREGGFGSKKVTGRDLKRIIDKDHEILVELMGEEQVSVLYKAAAKAGEEELTQEIVKQVAKSAGKLVLQMAGLGKIIKLLPLNRI